MCSACYRTGAVHIMSDMLADGIRLFEQEIASCERAKKRKRLELIRDSAYVQFDPKVGEAVICRTLKPAPGWSADWAFPDVDQACLEVGKKYVIQSVHPPRSICVEGVNRELHVTYFDKANMSTEDEQKAKVKKLLDDIAAEYELAQKCWNIEPEATANSTPEDGDGI